VVFRLSWLPVWYAICFDYRRDRVVYAVLSSGGDIVRKILYTFMLLGLAAVTRPVAAQSAPLFIGTWQADIKDQQRKDAPRVVIVRQDSSASYGTETVRWRLKPDSIMLALGGEWVTYRLQVKGPKLTLSGGDLAKPITLTRVGPPTPRPDSVQVPPDPDLP
jgi:hypothetical protein